jgi:ABC-type sugar transport system ATPase subunit
VTAATPLLEVTGLGRAYAGVAALADVDFSAVAGEVHAVVGANGAGKSTLMGILAGAIRPDAGEIRIDGQRLTATGPGLAQRAGIATVYQELTLVPQLSVARNIFLGREPVGRFGLVDETRLLADAARVLAENELALDPTAPVGTLSIAQQQLVELARALSLAPRILILDEPTAVLSLSEQQNLYRLVERLRTSGLLVLFVSHRLDEVLAIADRVTVLRDGRAVATRPVEGLAMADLVSLMVGDLGERRAESAAPLGDRPGITIRYQHPDAVQTIEVRPGEIVGLAGLVGAGRTTLARAIAGLPAPGIDVEVSLDDHQRRFSSPRQAMAAGIAYVTEDRKRDGLFANLDIVANTSAAALALFERGGLRRPGLERQRSADLLARLKLVAKSLDMPVAQLSGGNQQKVVFARALLRRPRLLLCDEPTRGVDVGAKAEIHGLLRELARSGVALIVISSEIDELLGLCHRILVMRDQAIVADLADHEADEVAILLAASGGVVDPTKSAAGGPERHG